MERSSTLAPHLVERERDGMWFMTDPAASKAGIVVVFTGRTGGRSEGAFSSLNLSKSVGDDDASVDANRALLVERTGLPSAPVFLRQVHGRDVIDVAEGSVGGETGDALVTSTNRPLGILTADCASIAMLGSGGIAMVHAGWRGLVAGVVGDTARSIGDVYAAWIGPCIRACCYEVGNEVIEAFANAGLPVADDHHVDVMEGAAHAARQAGVPHVVTAGKCTACEPDFFFSYRRDGTTGRQGGFIARIPR